MQPGLKPMLRGCRLAENVALALVAPGLQILRLKEQPVLFDSRKPLWRGYFALDGKRLVGKPKGLKLTRRNVHA